MADDDELFLTIIDRLSQGGVLTDIVLIGSWVLPVYRAYFNDAPEIPVLRTTDLDFLVGMPPKVRREFDVPAALSELGFEPEWSLQGDYCKYVHPDMEVEFLIPEQGRGVGRSISVDALRVEAQPLRFLSLAYDRSMVVRYRGYEIRVPEPEAFVLLKLLVIPRRKDRSKIEKDAYTARSLGDYLLDNTERRERLIGMFSELPKGWQRKIRSAAKEHFTGLLEPTS
ncbi:MAG: GSU2403 family nucleotidyltransferase fold protein [Spirochaetaceae bacterium]